MNRSGNDNRYGFFRSVMLAYLVLGLHLLLLAGIILMVFILRGVVNYLLWIFLGGLFTILASVYYFLRKMRAQGKDLKETLSSPLFTHRPVELSLFGGMASIKIGSQPVRIGHASSPVHQLEDPETLRIRELETLAALLEKNLITHDEYDQQKQRLLKTV